MSMRRPASPEGGTSRERKERSGEEEEQVEKRGPPPPPPPPGEALEGLAEGSPAAAWQSPPCRLPCSAGGRLVARQTPFLGAMLRLLPSLHALSKASAAGPRAPWPGPSRAGALSAHYRAGGAKPPAMQLPPGPRAASPLPGSRQPSEPCALRRRSSHDTFLAVRQLLERARSCGELLRWLVQNPDKVSAGHYALALQRLRRLFPRGSRRPGPPRLLLEQPDFQALTRAVASSCADFDHASLVRCLRASAALGLPGGCPLLQALEGEARRRRLGPLSQKHRSEARLLSLEREQRPQTPSRPRSAQVLPTLCRLLGQLKAAGEQELALLDETLAQCAPGAGDQALGALFSTPLFYENRQERFVRSMADWFPGKADGLTPPTMALIAKYLARHRLREPLLLDTIATFLLRRMEHLDIKPHELPAVPPRGALPPAGAGAGAEGGRLAPGHAQRPDVPLPARPLPAPRPAPGLLSRLPRQRPRQPLQADCASLPLPPGRGPCPGSAWLRGATPASPAPRAAVGRPAHCRRSQPQVQLQRPGGRSPPAAGGRGVLLAGRGAAPRILRRLPAPDHPFGHSAATRPGPDLAPSRSRRLCPPDGVLLTLPAGGAGLPHGRERALSPPPAALPGPLLLSSP
ncbi:fas-activated serine/threonine kinase isoform X4 [Hemicordylus capensis]|uniref:fas-activated serine/threonine kinase isoform X4 n=1 Tax=Hemicordylus capensis TaxID=884348 RepID=UPI002302742B|nr:fas-activated serine/threonine kinase isoform X4 [Hemicordylus capensis]